MIAWTIEAALHSQNVTRTLVTTDDAEIADTARRHGAEVPFSRPPELAQDDTPGIAPVLHAVRWLEEQEGYRPDIVANLQPTSPFRTYSDIDTAISLLVERKADSVVSVTAAGSHPYWMKTVDDDGWMRDLIQQPEPTFIRQRLPSIYSLNGAIYLAHREVLLSNGGWYTPRTAAYIMPSERSIDIDTPWDLSIARLVLDTIAG